MIDKKKQKILISAGENSGDQLGAHLALAMRKIMPQAQFYGMGGKKMEAAGVDIVVDFEKVSVVGLVEVITHLKDILATRKTLINLLKADPPDLLILIDLPDFNLNLAKHAKKAGVKVLYYVSPQIWAWRYGRIKTIKKNVDHLAVLFAFEKKLYDRENVSATFVGHPLTEHIKAKMSREEVYRNFQLNPNKPIVALLPGSRHSEVKRLMATIVDAAAQIRSQCPGVQFILALASNLTPESVKPYLSDDIQVIEENFHNLLSVCHAAITVSGTATLEVALHQVPLTVIYKVSALTYWVAKHLVKTPYIALCNIVAEKEVAREFIQNEATPDSIAAEVLRLLNDADYRRSRLDALQTLKAKTGEPGAAERAAEVAIRLLG